jgi:hypothetical protein
VSGGSSAQRTLLLLCVVSRQHHQHHQHQRMLAVDFWTLLVLACASAACRTLLPAPSSPSSATFTVLTSASFAAPALCVPPSPCVLSCPVAAVYRVAAPLSPTQLCVWRADPVPECQETQHRCE